MPDLEKSIWYTNYGVMYTCLPFSCNAHKVLHPGGGAVRGVDGSQSGADPLVQGVKLLPHIRVWQEGLVSLGCRGEGQGLGGRASQGERKVVVTQRREGVLSTSVPFKCCVFHGFSWKMCSANVRLVQRQLLDFSIRVVWAV